MNGTLLVVGASQGLGREFARQYAECGWQVLAGVRRPGSAPAGATELPLDACDAGSIERAAGELRGPLDLLVICAGAFGEKSHAFARPSDADFDRVMRTNVWAPIALIEAFAVKLRPGGTIAVLTSRMGSIADTTSAYGLLYRCSKAAANMVVKCAASSYAAQGARVIALHPGWVRTAMGGPEAPLEAPASVSGLRRVIGDPLRYPGGGFYNHLGDTLPW